VASFDFYYQSSIRVRLYQEMPDCPWDFCGGRSSAPDLWGFCGDMTTQEAWTVQERMTMACLRSHDGHGRADRP
jgi:hypothetical protein